jgi:hypothetical protein
MKLRSVSGPALALALTMMAGACDQQLTPAPPGDGATAELGPAPDRTPPDSGTSDAGSDTGSAEVGSGDSVAAECMPATHPGTVTFIDEDTGVTTVDNADTVPDSIKWHDTKAGRVPVVKVVKHKLPSGVVELLLYGPCGQLLEVVQGTTP